ncbi:L,D-transpeptidase family protein [Methylomonas sp. MgM2]
MILLQGCQTLPRYQAEHFSVTTGRAEFIESHDYGLVGNQGLIGTLATVESQSGDTLPDFARHFGLGFTDITNANPLLDPWVLRDHQDVLLPLQFILPDAPHNGIVLNLANMRMFYYPKNQNMVHTYPIGIGRDGWNTPLGSTKIIAKKTKPAWTVPASIQREHLQMGDPLPSVIRAGPDNPLGEYAMPLGFKGYLIHGTNKPYGIGMQVSHGCVQMYPEDVETLFNRVDIGMPVRIVHQPYLATWDQAMLYLEAHKPISKWAKQDKKLQKAVRNKLEALAAETRANIDWQRVDEVLERADGIPTPVLLDNPGLTQLKADAIKVARPELLYGQPTVAELTEQDWSVLMPEITDEVEAEKLAAMLNHLGPQIPARKIEKDGVYQVVAGPFKNKKETKSIARRIKRSFDLEVKTVKPLAKRE